MKKQPLFLCGLVCLLALSAAGDSQPLNLKLGLWETTIDNRTSGAPPIPDSVLAKMTPEQRARMEAALKARGAGGSQPRTYKNCLTKEGLNKALTWASSGKAGC